MSVCWGGGGWDTGTQGRDRQHGLDCGLVLFANRQLKFLQIKPAVRFSTWNYIWGNRGNARGRGDLRKALKPGSSGVMYKCEQMLEPRRKGWGEARGSGIGCMGIRAKAVTESPGTELRGDN